MKMKAKSVLSSVIALGLAFGAVSAQADDRHGFDAEGAMAKHGIERGGVSSEDYFEAMQNEARSRASGLGISSQDATARVGASSDSSG
ncbi:hypothetical protein, partial [Thioalkalivibrio sp. ALE16]|uniref:hypothetical protein n=1 Tax=Thioalkalivibrio sp. ALE16 TaxID=1158172 RepID=UPI0012DDFD96